MQRGWTRRDRWLSWIGWGLCAVMVAAWIAASDVCIGYAAGRWSCEFICGTLHITYHPQPVRSYGWEVYHGVEAMVMSNRFGFA